MLYFVLLTFLSLLLLLIQLISMRRLCSLEDETYWRYFRWKIQAAIDKIYPKRIFTNDQGTKEITTWDIFDSSGFICVVAFNNHSVAMRDQFEKGKVITDANVNTNFHGKIGLWTIWTNHSISFSIIQNGSPWISTHVDKFIALPRVVRSSWSSSTIGIHRLVSNRWAATQFNRQYVHKAKTKNPEP